MSSLLTPALNDVVTVNVMKHLISNPAVKWSNTYDFQVVDPTSGTLFTNMWTNCLAFEKLLTLGSTHFDEIRISTFLPDSKPYNPESFISYPVDQVGTAGAAGDPLPLGVAWHIVRNTATGRPGKLFLRETHGEGSVNSSGGFLVFSDPATVSAALASALTTSALGGYITGDILDANMVVAHYNRTTHAVTARSILGFTSRGPILARLSHRRKRTFTVHGA